MIVAIALAAVMHHAPIPAPPHISGPPRRSVMIEYRVKHGDTLWSIAARFCGGGQHWRWITRANGDRPAPRLLHAGELLAVPSVSD